MNRWQLLGALLGAVIGVTAKASADCAFSYDYDHTDLSIVSVTVDGVAVADLSAYDGHQVALEAGSGEGGNSRVVQLIVKDADGVEITVEEWE